MTMPIQVFIVLFVLLAVAMLVLQIVSEQFRSQTEELEKMQAKEKAQAEKRTLESNCEDACKCDTLMQKASFCTRLVGIENEAKGSERGADL